MEIFLSYALTILIGFAGACIGLVLKFPAGVLVGSMLGVGLVNVFSSMEVPNFPSEVRFLLQLGLGILLGSKLTIETLYTFKDLWRPALICAAVAIATGVLCGLLISRYLGVEELTAFLGTAPGGIADMSLIALDMGAKGSTVVVMHLIRLISVIIIVPLFVKLVIQHHTGQ
jgi:uncharacterized protein